MHDGTVYELNSMYALPEDAWTYELIGPRGSSGAAASLAVVIPDATPDDGPFTPMRAAYVRVLAEDGLLPWPILLRFVQLLEDSGDIRAGHEDTAVSGDLRLSNNSWRFGDRAYEVNSFHFADHDCWCYELYEVGPAGTENDCLDVRIPDLQPAGGPFVPATADRVTVTVHGSLRLPWPVLRHFLNVIQTSGDIIDNARLTID
jgi:hypothetical protein